MERGTPDILANENMQAEAKLAAIMPFATVLQTVIGNQHQFANRSKISNDVINPDESHLFLKKFESYNSVPDSLKLFWRDYISG